jgi:Co/Zn/Cd efflux system component
MGHKHDHGPSLTGRRLLFSVVITVAFVIGEAATGYFSNSLALMSDAGHNFADCPRIDPLVVRPLDRAPAIF